MINMADAVRQPRAKFAQTAAWLGVITADLVMQNWSAAECAVCCTECAECCAECAECAVCCMLSAEC